MVKRIKLTLCTRVNINVDVLIPNSKDFLDKLKGPKLKIPNFLIGNSKIFQLYLFSSIKSNSLGSLNGISKAGKLDEANIDNKPIKKDNNKRKTIGLHQTLKGRKLVKVITKRQTTSPILQ